MALAWTIEEKTLKVEVVALRLWPWLHH